MRQKRILVTGGSGFVGAHVLELARGKYEIHSTCLKNTAEMPGIKFHRIDLSQPGAADKLFQLSDPDVIVHLAAIANPDECEKNKSHASKVNYDFSVQLFDLARSNARRFIFVSTDLVFDGTGGEYDESSQPNPVNYYARLKVEVEKYILNSNADAVIARLALVYGLGLTRKNTFFEIMLKKFQSGEPVTLFCDQLRSPIWVEDAANALIELSANDFRGIIHLCSSKCLSRVDMGKLVCKIFDFPNDLIQSRSMDDFVSLAQRPRAICMTSKFIKDILKTKIHDPEEALQIIRKSMI